MRLIEIPVNDDIPILVLPYTVGNLERAKELSVTGEFEIVERPDSDYDVQNEPTEQEQLRADVDFLLMLMEG